MDELQIKCPFDGAILTVKNVPGIEKKNVPCPVCKNKYPFTQFKIVSPVSGSDSDTDYSGAKEEKTSYGEQVVSEDTDLGNMNFTIGRLRLEGTGILYQLRPGRNIVGRKAEKSGSDFKIDTGINRKMSREHIVIEVKKVPSKGFVHYLSLFKEKVNKTYIGTEELLFGDCIVLNNGDMIRLPDANLKFEIPDEEGTEY